MSLSCHLPGAKQAPGIAGCVDPCAFCVDQCQRLMGMGSWEAQSLPLSSYPEVCSVTNTTPMNTTVTMDPANLASRIAEGL